MFNARVKSKSFARWTLMVSWRWRSRRPGEADSTQASGTGPGVGHMLRWVLGLLLIIGYC